MQNTPYDLSEVTPLETLQLGRLQAAEQLILGLIGVIKLQLPSTKPLLDGLIQQAGKNIDQAEEQAASQWLFVTDPYDAAGEPIGSYDEALALSESEGAVITQALSEYLPGAGLASVVGHIGHPVCIGLNRFLEPWGKPVDLPDDPTGFVEALLAAGKELKLYRSRVVHPMSQEEPLFIIGGCANHALVIAPARLTWHVVTFPTALTLRNPPFFHRQARVVDVPKALKELYEIFGSLRQGSKLRALLREKALATTTIQVLLTDIFQYNAFTMAEACQVDLFHYRGVLRDHPKFRKVVLIHRVENQGQGLQLLFEPESPKQAFILVGESMVPTEIDAMQPQTKAIVIEVLSALVKNTRPPKKKTVKPT
jgi:hypothetical protein